VGVLSRRKFHMRLPPRNHSLRTELNFDWPSGARWRALDAGENPAPEKETGLFIAKRPICRRICPITTVSTGCRRFPWPVAGRTVNSSQAATDRPAARRNDHEERLRPVRHDGKRACLPEDGAETYGAAESVPTPMADR
jgi:hypothetical protein